MFIQDIYIYLWIINILFVYGPLKLFGHGPKIISIWACLFCICIELLLNSYYKDYC